ncbi:MAG: type II toxin-antitoxin system VapC family toxin [Caldilineaceae bacterium]
MTKTFSTIPARVTVMIDANILIYALFPQSRQHASCKHLLERGARSELALQLVVNTAADVIHRAMVLEVISQGKFQKSGDAVTYLKQTPQAVQQLTRYRTILSDITLAHIKILPLTYRDLHTSRQYRDNYGVMTNDSLILAVMQRERIQFLATNDSDFERVPGIAVRQPD